MTNINNESCRLLLAMMNETVGRIVVLTHANPDGDALGSSLGLNCVLQNAGFDSTVVFPTNFPSIVPDFQDYRGWIIFEHHEKSANKLIQDADLIFVLDFNDWKRLGKMKKSMEKSNAAIVLVDHHPEPAIEALFSFSDTSVSSTAELVYDFVVKMGWSNCLDAKGAGALLTGIIADTASFSHNARRPELYKAVGNLIELGADQLKIQEALFNTNSENRLRLLGFALSEKMEIFHEFHTAIIVLASDELKHYDFKIGDTEGFVNYPLTIKGIIFSAFFMENEDKIKISFRSKGGFAVNEFSASHFGGGGHHNAAGGESKRTLRETTIDFMNLLPKYAEALEAESQRMV